MLRSGNHIKHKMGLTLLLVCLVLASAQLGIPFNPTTNAGHISSLRGSSQGLSGTGLDTDREAALKELYSHFKAGAPFSKEEAYLLSRFHYWEPVSDNREVVAILEPLSTLEADVVISRALYTQYVVKQVLSKKERKLLQAYKKFVAQKGRRIADLKPLSQTNEGVSPQQECDDAIVLTFEGLENLEPAQEFYNGGFGGFGSGPGPSLGISFSSNSLALIDADAGGSGNIGGEPSPSTVLFFLTGSGAVMNVPAGFTEGFSFFYSAPFFDSTVNVYSDVNATGTLLAQIPLPRTPNNGAPDPTGQFSPLVPVGVSFIGVAKSVDFSGTGNQVVFDNITIGCSTPIGGCTITCPGDITRANDPGQCCASNVYQLPTAGEGCDVSCNPPPSFCFPVGTTVVTCTAQSPGNVPADSCSFTVTVNDTQAPTIASCPGDVVQNAEANQCSAVVDYPVPGVTDNCPGATIICIPPSGQRLDAGTSQTVTCTATDLVGNTSACSFRISVRDAQPPTIVCPTTPVQIDAQGACTITVPDITAAVRGSISDACTPASSLIVTQSPAANSSVGSDLRSINVTVSDAAGVSRTCQVPVTVINRGGAAAQVTVGGGELDLSVNLLRKAKKRRR